MTAHASAEGARRTRALLLWALLAGLQIAAAFAIAGSGDDGVEPIYEWATAVNAIVVYGLLIGLTFWIASIFPSATDALGFKRFGRRSLWHAAVVVVLSVVLAAVLEPILHAGEEQGIAPTEWESGRVAPFIVNAVLIATWGPFVEELFYRGLGVKVLGVFGSTGAISISGLTFGFAHGLLVALPPLVFFGLGLAWVRQRSGSVWPAVIAHCSYNAIGIAIAVALID